MSIFNSGCGPCNQVPYTDLHSLNLDWILCTVKQLDASYDELVKEVTDKLTEFGAKLEDVEEWIAQFDPEEFKKYIRETVDEYLKIGVFFGLTQDGYFVAYKPEHWSDLKFGTTGLDVFPGCQTEYGHLTLSY